MTADQLRECREAFEKWADDEGLSVEIWRGGLYYEPRTQEAWSGWQAAWNARPTAVASHAEGEVVAYSVPSGHAMPDGSMEDGPWTLVFADEASDYEKRIGIPLYYHPPRARSAGEDARDEVIASMRELANTFRRVEPNIIEKQAVVYRYAADQIDKTIDAAMAARGGEKAA